MSFVLYRIDDRLIHGQVVVGWGQPLDVKFIVLVDDAVATSEWEQELYRMGVPPGMDVYFLSVEMAGEVVPELKEDARRGILLTGDIATMRKLVDRGIVESVNVGGIHHRAGREQKVRYIFLTEAEAAELKGMGARVKVFGQDVPGAREVSLQEILTGIDE